MSNKSLSEKALGEAAEELSDPARQFVKDIAPAGKHAANIIVQGVKAVDLALSPLYGIIWTGERIKEWINEEVARKLQNVPREDIITPNPTVAGPAIEAMRFVGEEKDLRELFSNLLANSMDKRTASSVHPSFVEIIKQISPDEAKILSNTGYLISKVPILEVRISVAGGYQVVMHHYSDIATQSKCEHPDLVGTYIDNLCRLELCSIPSGQHLVGENVYYHLENAPDILAMQSQFESSNTKLIFQKKVMQLTDFGLLFIRTCVTGKQ